jgi:triacylglycerol lipase
MSPNNGQPRLELLAEQVDQAATSLLTESKSDRLDLVGYSMGALVSRLWVQRGAGKQKVRRFVSISGPHHGTATAWALPFAGIKQMRPGSELLRDLERDKDPWGSVETHAFWTPFDLMIVPPRSSRLPHAREQVFSVLMHGFMISDRRVLDAVSAVLAAPEKNVTNEGAVRRAQ